MEITKKLQTTAWLAEQLGLSVRTVEKIRCKQPEQLPACIYLGRTVRYDQQVVEDCYVPQYSR